MRSEHAPSTITVPIIPFPINVYPVNLATRSDREIVSSEAKLNVKGHRARARRWTWRYPISRPFWPSSTLPCWQTSHWRRSATNCTIPVIAAPLTLACVLVAVAGQLGNTFHILRIPILIFFYSLSSYGNSEPRRGCASASFDSTVVYGNTTPYHIARRSTLNNQYHDKSGNVILFRLEVIVNTCKCQTFHCM